MSSFNRRLLTIYVLVLAVGVGLSVLIYWYGQRIIQSGAMLTHHSVPGFDNIANLRQSIFSQKPILYEYYATTDRNKFLADYRLVQRASVDHLFALRQIHGKARELSRVEDDVERIFSLAEELDMNLGSDRIDWDQARDTLAQVSAVERRIAPELDALVAITRDEVNQYGNETNQLIWHMIRIVAGVTILGIILSLFIAHYVRSYLRDLSDRKLLATFPERSPNPMLRLDTDGHILYANDAAHALCDQRGLTRIEDMLPADIQSRMAQLRGLAQPQYHWEYTFSDRVLDCNIHLLEDLNLCHVYLIDVTQRKKAEQRLVRQARHDAITDLPNRHQFREHLDFALDNAIGQCAVALIKPDRIKLVLESQGYSTSDNIIRAMAARLASALDHLPSALPRADLFRFEGATFGILITNVSDASQLDALMLHFQHAMLEPLVVEGREYFFTLSFGIAISPEHGEHADTLFKNAEAAVNRARLEGGNVAVRYTHDLSERTEQWLSLEQGLRRAIERDELLLHYQPQVDLHTGNIIGTEALIRWQHSERGIVSPAQFIPLAEDTGLIIPIGAWILRTACLQAKHWFDQGNALIMAVNISARQFQHPGFVDLVEEILRETGLPAHCLELEITESVAMQDAERTTAILHDLRQLGLHLSIDDFGTGFSSLAYLRRFPLSKLKVDQSFVRNLSVDEHDSTIVQTVILLGHSLKLKVIAEGVETKEQLDVLRRLGCEEMQGFYFSRPIPAAELSALLKEGRRLAA